jgi:membrane-associated phospholipid phosphatase
MTRIIIVFMADYLVYILGLSVVVYCLLIRNKELLIRCIVVALLSWLIGFLIKNLFYLPRPFIFSGLPPLITPGLDGSFPSNHTTLAFGLSLPLFSKKGGIIFIFLAGLVSLGRVLAGVHTLIDVTAGIIIALGLTLVTHNARLLKTLWHFH